jgi:hypothetical protein
MPSMMSQAKPKKKNLSAREFITALTGVQFTIARFY